MHIGFDFTPPDVPGKVTGEIKYAEDYKKEGMVFARLLTSPLPSGRVAGIDATEALRMDGVVGIFTADDLPQFRRPEIQAWHQTTLLMSGNRFWPLLL